MMKRSSLLAICVATLLLSEPGLAKAACLSDGDARRVIAEGGLVPLRSMMDVADRVGGRLISARLCGERGALHYRVVVDGADGSVQRLRVDAVTGEVLNGR